MIVIAPGQLFLNRSCPDQHQDESYRAIYRQDNDIVELRVAAGSGPRQRCTAVLLKAVRNRPDGTPETSRQRP